MRFLLASLSLCVGLLLVHSVRGEAEGEAGADSLKKIETLQAREAENPQDWKIPFKIGQIYKHERKDCARALPAYERSAEKSGYREAQVLIEMGFCSSKLGQNEKTIQAFERHLALTGGRLDSEKARSLLASAYLRDGHPEKALPFAKPGSPAWIRASDKTMRLEMKIAWKEALGRFRLENEKKIRITLPLDRPYQRLLSYEIKSTGRGVEVSREPVVVGLNRYAEISRGDAWPDEIVLTMLVSQRVASIFEGSGPEMRVVHEAASPLYAEASFNPDNEYSLNDEEFLRIVDASYHRDSPVDVGVRESMDYLRSHFKYARRRLQRKAGALAVWKSGQGDCGFYSMLAMAMLRARGIPVRRLYGLNILRDGSTHVIVEMYDDRTRQWFPHDPIIAHYFGFINPMYIPFSSDLHVHGRKRIDGVAHIDTPEFFWIGNRPDRLRFEVKVGETIVHASTAAATLDLEPSEKATLTYPDL